MKYSILSVLIIMLFSAKVGAQDYAEPLKWKVFTIKRDGVTRDPNMPSGNEKLRWVVNTSTLIYGDSDAVLVDVFLTIDQTNQLVNWIRESGKNLKAVYLTHAHADHIYGAKIIANNFPGVKVFALPSVIEDFSKQYDKDYIESFWQKLFPGDIPDEFIMPEPVHNNELEIEGRKLIMENVGFTDTDNTTFVYVPSIGLVVAGDIVYNGIHPYLAETTPNTRRDTRREWIAALDKIESLNPKFVIAGHKIPENSDDPVNVKATRNYLIDFERINNETSTTLELYNRMLEVYPDRVNPGSLWGSAKAAKE